MEKSSIKIISNIALKSKFDKNQNAYLPYDLLPAVYHDVRASNDLTPYQQKQQLKKLFWTENVVDVDIN